MKLLFTFILCFALAAIFYSCSTTKHLAPNQSLYDGSKVHIQSSDTLSKKQKKTFTKELQSLIRPEPNAKILGFRFKLWVYYFAGTPKKHGLRYWLKYKVGEPPVLASMTVLEKNRQVLQNRMENRGFFKDTVLLDTQIKHKELTATYTVQVGAQYHLRQILYPEDSTVLSNHIRATAKESLLKPKQPYNLDNIIAERIRIDAALKNKGFFYFNPAHLIAYADSTVGNHKVDISIKPKPEMPSRAKRRYRINEVVIFPNYDINSDTSLYGATRFAQFLIKDTANTFQPKIFGRAIPFKKGDFYSREVHNLALNRLISLGVFKFVKANFVRADTVKGNYLNAFFYLTPTEKKSLRFQVSALTKSNNATGGELSVNWRHRNLLRGAELFSASIYGGIEQQISSGIDVSTKRAGIDLNLFIPRIIAPFRFKTNSAYIPQTKINTAFELYNRNTQYTLTSIRGSFGYIWKENIRKEHQLNVLAINYVKPAHITDSFQLQLDTNLALKRSIEKQFIIGPNYNFNYNSQATPNHKKHNFYFNGNIDLSGNLIGLISGANLQEGNEKKIFNTPFSQYARFEADVRHYWSLGGFRSLNTRFLAGVGFAYGNSYTMPFIKAFFAGGVNDIRAFRARTLGPGTYYAGNAKDSFIAEQPGDIKLELNIEYRAKLFSILRWAAFIDAGNVWTQKEDSIRSGAKFSGNFLNQIAVGAGLGLRADINILVIRLDVAFPLRLPYLPSDSKWVFDKIDFGSSEWRKNNLIFNLAIGYPF